MFIIINKDYEIRPGRVEQVGVGKISTGAIDKGMVILLGGSAILVESVKYDYSKKELLKPYPKKSKKVEEPKEIPEVREAVYPTTATDEDDEVLDDEDLEEDFTD